MPKKPRDPKKKAGSSWAVARLADIDDRHGQYMDEVLAAFSAEIDRITETASVNVTEAAVGELTLAEDGTIHNTVENLRVLQRLDVQFAGEMKRLGYNQAVRALVGEFPNQLPLMEETFAVLNRALKLPLTAGKLLSQDDFSALLRLQGKQVKALRDVVPDIAAIAKKKALARVNGMKPGPFARLIENTFERTEAQAQTLAATSMAVFYRKANERSLEKVEKELPLRYTYDGPRDVLNRDFCRALKDQAREGKTWSKAEIDAMHNGQIPDVFLTCGGYNCRHQWRIALEDD